MKIVYDLESPRVDVSLRQSWLNTARDCMERGRRNLIDPDADISTDAACIGTAVHAGAAAGLITPDLTRADVIDLSVAEWIQMCESSPIRWVSYNPESGHREVASLAASWFDSLRTKVVEPLKVEEEFSFEADSFYYGHHEVHIHLTGTADLLCRDSLWDWKTSKKKYSWRDKQADAIQPTVYAAWAVNAGFLQWPVQFNYGVMLRGTRDTQVVTVQRTADHLEWLLRTIRPLVRHALHIGTREEWPMSDNHSLCTDTWCPWWAMCKGAHVAPIPYPTRSGGSK